MSTFKIEGFENLGPLAKRFGKESQRRVDNAARRGLTKGLENVVYGRPEGIRPNNVSGDSAIKMAARAVGVEPHHIFFRTFIKGVKTGSGGGGPKPYASAMMRTNSINVTSLLVSNINHAKEMYGFKGRKGKISKSSKKRPSNMSELVDKARIGGRTGMVRIAGKIYRNTFIENGATRASSKAMNRYYIDKLGADSSRPGLGGGNNYLAIQRKNQSQPKPYPTKAVKIDQKKVQKAFDAALKLASKRRASSSRKIQKDEVIKELKKIGFKVS